MKEQDPLGQKSIEILMEAGRRLNFYDRQEIHPFTKKISAAIAYLSNEEIAMDAVTRDLNLDDNLHPLKGSNEN